MKYNIKVAALQIGCLPSEKQRNLQHAEARIRQAVTQEATLLAESQLRDFSPINRMSSFFPLMMLQRKMFLAFAPDGSSDWVG